MTMIRALTALALLLGSTLTAATPIGTSTPAPIDPPGPNSAPAIVTPAMQLRMAVDSLLAFMNQDPRPAPAAIARFLDAEIAPYFDFDHMARSAGGRLYAHLSGDQRDAMADEIKRMFLTGLTEKLASYGGQQVRYLPMRITPGGRQAVVSMMILNSGSYYPSRIDFRLLKDANGWAIIDLAANGQSAVMYYRGLLRRETLYRAYRARQQSQPPLPQ